MWNIAPASAPIQGWHLLAIFISLVIALITSVAPMSQVCLSALVIVAISGVLDPNDYKKSISYALSGFSNTTVWLPVSAFFLSTAIIKTGFGRRISLILLKHFGGNTIGVAYAIFFGNFVLSPVVPSIAAKAGGIFFPVINSISETLASKVDCETIKTKQYFNQIGAQAGALTGAAFLTGAPFLPLLAIMAAGQGVDLSWANWFFIMAPVVLVASLLSPLVNYIIIKPEIIKSPNIPSTARRDLKRMKRVTFKEKILITILIFTILALAFSRQLDLNSTTIIFTAIVTMLFTDVITWKDVMETRGAWNLLTWFAALIMIVDFLGKLGITEWFANTISGSLDFGWSPMTYYVAITTVYYLMHYIFASNIAQALTLYQSFLMIGISMGVPNVLMASSLAITSVMFGSLTQYASGTGAIYFGSGHFSVYEWWRIGFFIMIFNLAIIFTVGTMWWSMWI